MQTRRVLTSTHEYVPGVHTQFAQRPAAQVCVDPHAVVVEPRPSALQTWRLLPAQSALPGVHTHAPQSPVLGVQLEPAAQLVVAENDSPSALQVCVPVEPTQLVDPGVQTHGVHAPALHDCPAAQVVASQRRPSAEQTSARLVLPAAQRAAPGVQTRARHEPSRQLSAVPHGVAVVPCPSGVHTSRADAEAQVDAPGAHLHGVQAPAPVQAFIAAHGAGLYPRPSALQTRRVSASTQELAPGVHTQGTHAPAEHDCMAEHAAVV